jgi:hypothetical protein
MVFENLHFLLEVLEWWNLTVPFDDMQIEKDETRNNVTSRTCVSSSLCGQYAIQHSFNSFFDENNTVELLGRFLMKRYLVVCIGRVDIIFSCFFKGKGGQHV